MVTKILSIVLLIGLVGVVLLCGRAYCRGRKDEIRYIYKVHGGLVILAVLTPYAADFALGDSGVLWMIAIQLAIVSYIVPRFIRREAYRPKWYS